MQINWLRKSLTINAMLLIFVVFSISQSVFSEDNPLSPISVNAKMDKTNITVGDVVRFIIIVRADKDIQSFLPNFNKHFLGFELIDNGIEDSTKNDGKIESVYWYRLRADLPGTYTIPPVPLKFTVPDPQNNAKTIQGQISTPEIIVEIKSILHLHGEPKDIRDIKPILDISIGWLNYLSIFLLLLILVGLAIWFWRKKKPAFPVVSAVQTPNCLLAHELAIYELKTLKAKGWLEKGKFREYYFELSEIFRRYMGSRFSIPALDWTIEEISSKLKGQLNAELWQQAQSILEHSDLVKFAKSTPSFGDSIETMDSTISFIESTQLVKEVETSKT